MTHSARRDLRLSEESQKVKQVQGQQRPRPSPPPAKKVSGPGGIIGEEDFEEEDVICID